MSERERLIELLKYCPFPFRRTRGDIYYNKKIADYLLANGVIVPPVKVGDKVYYIGGTYHHLIKCARVEAFEVNQTGVSELYVCSENGVYFQTEAGKFYSTKEEAEKALKGGAE